VVEDYALSDGPGVVEDYALSDGPGVVGDQGPSHGPGDLLIVLLVHGFSPSDGGSAVFWPVDLGPMDSVESRRYEIVTANEHRARFLPQRHHNVTQGPLRPACGLVIEATVSV
jgi:hypothetical protein